MKKFIEKQYNQRAPEASLFVAGVLFCFSLLVLIFGILPRMSELVSSTDPLNMSAPWMEALIFELIFGVLFLGLLIDHWAYKTKRTEVPLTFFNYLLGGILFGVVAGTIVIVVLTKVLGINCYNLYILIPLFGAWCGMAFGIILHWKKPKESNSKKVLSFTQGCGKGGNFISLILLGVFFLSSSLFAQNLPKKEKEKASAIEVYAYPREVPISYVFPYNVKDSSFWQNQIIKLHIKVYDLEEANTKLRLRINGQEEQMNLLIKKVDSLSAVLGSSEVKEIKKKK